MVQSYLYAYSTCNRGQTEIQAIGPRVQRTFIKDGKETITIYSKRIGHKMRKICFESYLEIFWRIECVLVNYKATLNDANDISFQQLQNMVTGNTVNE